MGLSSASERPLAVIAAGFEIEGRVVAAAPLGSGHVNETYAVTLATGTGAERYVLQRINGHVFADPEAMMANVLAVTRHLRAGLEAEGVADLERRTLTWVAAHAGGWLHRDGEGAAWRACRFIEGARSHDVPASPPEAYEAARAFGYFQRRLLDLPASSLGETLPGFHHTVERLAAFRVVLAADALGRAASCREEIELALSHEELAGSLLALAERGEVPVRVTHNDCKVNNVLLDEATGEGLCVIDLDTVMPGLSLWDFGDLVRTATCRAAEDERALGRVEVEPEMFAAVVRGYLEAMGPHLTAAERAHLVTAGKVITFETGLRFLTDHLDGDRYFRIHRPGHNLDRCRSQFALLASLEAQEGDLARLAEALGAQ